MTATRQCNDNDRTAARVSMIVTAALEKKVENLKIEYLDYGHLLTVQFEKSGQRYVLEIDKSKFCHLDMRYIYSELKRKLAEINADEITDELQDAELAV